MTFWTWPTLATLTAGSVGSGITLFGAYLVTRMSIKSAHAAAAVERAVAAEAADRELRRNAAVAANIVQQSLLREVHRFPFARGRTVAALIELILTVGVAARRSHPAVADWIADQCAALNKSVDLWRAHWWNPWATRRTLRSAGQQAENLINALFRWSTGVYEDAWFAGQSEGADGTPSAELAAHEHSKDASAASASASRR